MHNKNKHISLDENSAEHQRSESHEDIINKKDALFAINSYPAEDMTRTLIVERNPVAADGETWPDSGWILTGEGVHPKTGERVAKLEKLEHNEAGEVLYDSKGNPLISVKYQPYAAALAYDERQRQANAVAHAQIVSPREALLAGEELSIDMPEQAVPDVANPVRFSNKDAVRIVRYRTGNGENRGVVVGYYYSEKGDVVDLVQPIDRQGVALAEVSVVNGEVIDYDPSETHEEHEYDKLFDPNFESNYSVEDAAVRPAETAEERLARERHTSDAEDAANKAYLRRKDGYF